jgi:uncharacterized protein
MDIFLIVVATVFFVLGFIGLILPILPSLPLMWLGVVIYAFFTDFSVVTTEIVLWTGVMALVGTLLDLVAGAFGAKAYGASWIGMIGAFVGGVLGFVVFNLVGMILGSAFGTFAGEYLQHKDVQSAKKATIGSLIGFFFGTVVKLVVGIAIIAIFFRAIF